MRTFGRILVSVFFTTLVILSGCTIPQLAPSITPAAIPPSTTANVTPTSPPPSTTVASTAQSPTAKATPQTPSGPQMELLRYMLDLINKDRAQEGLAPVALGYNAASQKHAEEMLANYYLSHWDMAGLKPYMRYTLEGGYNYDMENSAYSGWFNRSVNPARYPPLDVKNELEALEHGMMYDDAASNWGHRDNILNPWHRKVNIGIAYDKHRLALVQQFEGDYIQFTQLPALSQNVLSLSGKLSPGTVDAVVLYYDAVPQPKTPSELVNGPRSYSLGEEAGHIIPPPPPGQYYSKLPAGAIQASQWNVDQSGPFSIKADVSPALSHGKGVYTLVIWSRIKNSPGALTNYSIFIK